MKNNILVFGLIGVITLFFLAIFFILKTLNVNNTNDFDRDTYDSLESKEGNFIKQPTNGSTQNNHHKSNI